LGLGVGVGVVLRLLDRAEAKEVCVMVRARVRIGLGLRLGSGLVVGVGVGCAYSTHAFAGCRPTPPASAGYPPPYARVLAVYHPLTVSLLTPVDRWVGEPKSQCVCVWGWGGWGGGPRVRRLALSGRVALWSSADWVEMGWSTSFRHDPATRLTFATLPLPLPLTLPFTRRPRARPPSL
jgi:hypothetical protein